MNLDTPIRFVCAALTLCFMSLAEGQSCGNSPGAFQYSDRFYQAEAKLYESAAGFSSEASIIYDDLPIKGSLSGNQSIKNYESLTTEQARSYIQQEHSDRGAQIIAECGYRLCTLASVPNSLNQVAISVLGEVCTRSINPGDATIGMLAVSPRVSTTIFDTSTSQTRKITIANTSPGAITVNAVLDQGTIGGTYLSILGPTSFTIPAKRDQTVQIRVKRPARGATVLSSLKLTANADPKVTATTDFVIYSDPSLLLPPATILTGLLYPNAVIKLDEDNNTSPFIATQPGPYSLPLKYVPQGPQKCNPGGTDACAQASYTESMTSPPSTLDQVSAVFHLDSTIGGKCGRGNSGGDAGINPRWETTLSLPGLADRHRWNVKVSTDINHISNPQSTASCTATLKTRIDILKSNGVSGVDYVGLLPGSYVFEASCTGSQYSVGCHGHAGRDDHYENPHYSINLDAHREKRK